MRADLAELRRALGAEDDTVARERDARRGKLAELRALQERTAADARECAAAMRALVQQQQQQQQQSQPP